MMICFNISANTLWQLKSSTRGSATPAMIPISRIQQTLKSRFQSGANPLYSRLNHLKAESSTENRQTMEKVSPKFPQA